MTVQVKKKGEIKLKARQHRGLGFKVFLFCSCHGEKVINLGPFVNNGYEINRRIVFATPLLGVGREAIHLFTLMVSGVSICYSTYETSSK